MRPSQSPAVDAVGDAMPTVAGYRVEARLGRGGFGEVYAAEEVATGRAVAIKLLRADAPLAARAAFATEVERARAIVHPNVVRVEGASVDGGSGRPYLVMELLRGPRLLDHLAAGPLSEDAARDLGAGIADGLAAAHAGGIVHRDLTPANVILVGDRPVVIDFGLARAADDRATTASRVGTVAYMAPEQLTHGAIAATVDVWALGVILFEMTAGALPFADHRDGRCPQLVDDAPPLARRAPVSPAFAALVARCLDRDPGRRPATMAEVARALRAPAPTERITADVAPDAIAPPASAIARAPTARPHVGRAALLGVGAVVAIALGGAWLARRPEPAAAATPDAAVDATAAAATPDAAVDADAVATPDAAIEAAATSAIDAGVTVDASPSAPPRRRPPRRDPRPLRPYERLE